MWSLAKSWVSTSANSSTGSFCCWSCNSQMNQISASKSLVLSASQRLLDLAEKITSSYEVLTIFFSPLLAGRNNDSIHTGLRYASSVYLGSSQTNSSNSQRFMYFTDRFSRFFRIAASISISQPSNHFLTIRSTMLELNPNWKRISYPKCLMILDRRLVPMMLEYILC